MNDKLKTGRPEISPHLKRVTHTVRVTPYTKDRLVNGKRGSGGKLLDRHADEIEPKEEK